MSVVLFLAGASGDCGRRELANCCNGFRNTPPGWVWREQGPGGALNLAPEDAWRRQGRLGAAPPPPPRQEDDALFCPSDDAMRRQLEQIAAGGVFGRPATFQEIGAFENACGAPLPRDYVEFLRAGQFTAQIARFFDAPDADGGFDALQCFFGFGLPWSTCNLDYVRQLYAGGAPDGVIPIAGNGAGDYVCLDLRGGDTARQAPVALWRIDHFWRAGEWREQDFIPLAESFSAFVLGLRQAPRRAAGDGNAARQPPSSQRAPSHVAAPPLTFGPLLGRWSA
ncbi:SMI1/KNR4 family protein [Camelimonas lactis]|nr:SMI1/KNR4 family protein [Camelimonas lactis]